MLQAVPQADHIVPLVVHLLGGGDAKGALLAQDVEAVLCGWHCDWGSLLLPVWQQLSEGMGLQHVARENVSACRWRLQLLELLPQTRRCLPVSTSVSSMQALHEPPWRAALSCQVPKDGIAVKQNAAMQTDVMHWCGGGSVDKAGLPQHPKAGAPRQPCVMHQGGCLLLMATPTSAPFSSTHTLRSLSASLHLCSNIKA